MSKPKILGAVESAMKKAGLKVTGGRVTKNGVEVAAILENGNPTTKFDDQKPSQQSFGFDTTFDFLGDEFLTWVWWKCDTGEAEFVRLGSSYGVAFEDLLQFAPCQDQDHVQTLRGGSPTRAAEARTALRRGHLLRKARILIAEGDRAWSSRHRARSPSNTNPVHLH